MFPYFYGINSHSAGASCGWFHLSITGRLDVRRVLYRSSWLQACIIVCYRQKDKQHWRVRGGDIAILLQGYMCDLTYSCCWTLHLRSIRFAHNNCAIYLDFVLIPSRTQKAGPLYTHECKWVPARAVLHGMCDDYNYCFECISDKHQLIFNSS